MERPGVELLLRSALLPIGICVEPPRVDHQSETGVVEGAGPAGEHLFVKGERVGDRRMPRLGQDSQRGLGDEAVGERGANDRHLAEAHRHRQSRPAVPDRLLRGGRQPVGGRAMTDAPELVVGDDSGDLVELGGACASPQHGGT